ncbi:MAG: hypothetical protein LUO96_06400, partial [Methanomicrobiales archaeon]|nr:hypothetical protein [Methanomicrobiales archaeon]
GYADYRADLIIAAGERREISALLRPLTPTPAGTMPTTTTPAAGNPLPVLVPVGAGILVILGCRRS